MMTHPNMLCNTYRILPVELEKAVLFQQENLIVQKVPSFKRQVKH